MNIGTKIRYVRELRGLSLTDLHQKTGLSLSYLSDAENGKCQMSLKSLFKVALSLGVDVSFIIDDRTATLDQIARVKGYELPEEVKEYVSEADSLPYIVLAKKAHEYGLSTDFLSKMIDLYKKEKENSK